MTGYTDVIVVGGGPAGSISALVLRRMGFSVRLIEAQAGARPHIGEAISIAVLRHLHDLGLQAVLDRAGWRMFARCEERWESDAMIVRSAPPGSATVDRGRFDEALRDACRDARALVSSGIRVSVVRPRGGGGWCVSLVDGTTFTTSFVVDAAGRRGILPKTRHRLGPQTIALFGYWSGTTLPRHPRIAAGAAAWAWGAPVGDLGYNATLFVDRDALAGQPGDLRAIYLDGLASTGILRGDPVRGECPSVSVCDASAWLDLHPVGPDYIKVGEAAQSFDPLASMGVQRCIQAARSAGVVVNTSLQRPASHTLARQYYEERLQRSAKAHSRATAEIYRRSFHAGQPFWRARASVGVAADREDVRNKDVAPVAESTPIFLDHARIVEQPCLCGDFVEPRLAVLAGPEREPVAFLGDLTMAEIVKVAGQSATFGALHEALSRGPAGAVADRVCEWLIGNGVVGFTTQ